MAASSRFKWRNPKTTPAWATAFSFSICKNWHWLNLEETNHALSRQSSRESRPGKTAAASHRRRLARSRLDCRRRIRLRSPARAQWQGWCSTLGRDLFLRHAAGRGAALLGGIFRVAQREGRAQPQELPARKRQRTVGVLELRLHQTTRRTVAATRRIVS